MRTVREWLDFHWKWAVLVGNSLKCKREIRNSSGSDMEWSEFLWELVGISLGADRSLGGVSEVVRERD